jgi:ribonuclease HI
VVLTDQSGRVLATIGRGIGPATNNVAEYTACLEGLRLAEEHGARRVTVRSDSRLLVEQLSGRFRVKNATLIRLHTEVRKVARGFEEVAFEHVPREENAEADRLANQGVDEWLMGEGRGYAPAEPSPPLFD